MSNPDADVVAGDDDLAEANRAHEEFLRQLKTLPEGDIFGVVNASGSGGGRYGDDPWQLVVTLAGWRHGTEELQREELRTELTVSEEALKIHMKNIRPYSILHLRGRVGRHPSGRMRAILTEIVSWTHRDAGLEAVGAELRKPVIHTDPELGDFTLDRSVNWFAGTMVWQGEEIRLDLPQEAGRTVEETLLTAKALLANQDEWAARIGDHAVAEMLALKNDCWLEEGDAEVTAEEFKGRMSLVSLTVQADGSFSFSHDDGDLFWGHTIEVSGNLRDGLLEAQIQG